MDDLLVDFIAETRETLDLLSGEIVAWEARPDDRTRLDTIFRFFHTVKGSCGFLNLPRLERLSHAAEDVLADCRAGRRSPDPELVNAVLAVIDRIAILTDALESGEGVPHDDDDQLIAALAPTGAEEIEEGPEGPSMAAIRAPAAQRGLARSIRLPVELLDRMMAGVSDMVLARNDLARRLRDAGVEAGVEAAFERLSTSIAEMRDSITRTRMARIDNLFSALPRMVRDLASELGKQVSIETDGGDVELDREMIEMIRDPLTHIVRNAIDHGIERPADRAAAGKPPAGALRVSARQAGNQIAIEAVDDGRGVDADRLVEKAIAAGQLTPERAAGMSWHAKLQLIFMPGLSTAENVTAISGRGVGMDVVRANVERIGGVVEVDSKPGHGLRLSMKVPLTLTIIPALTVAAGGRRFAIPRSAIEELVRVKSGNAVLGELGGARIVTIRGRRLPVVMLAPFLELGPGGPENELTMVVIRPAGGHHYALGVDTVHDHEELVIKPAAPVLMATGVYAGTTLPDNSHPMLLLDPAGIAKVAGVLDEAILADEPVQERVVEAERVPTLLFRDLDGAERAIRLSLVERIEEIRGDTISHSAGRDRVVLDGKLVPLLTCPGAQRRPERILRLADGFSAIAYGVAEIVDIMAVDTGFERAIEPGVIAGVTLVDGRPVELLDPFWLFAHSSEQAVAPPFEPLCLLSDGDDPWTRQMLVPLLKGAGYRVAFPGDIDAVNADLLILTGKDSEGAGGLSLAVGGATAIRLSANPETREPGVVYRYDRDGLLNALRAGAEASRRWA